jgi:hypothetical protein
MPFSMRGKAGRLLWGSRVVSEFSDWSATSEGPNRFSVAVSRHAPDPVYWEHHGDLTAELEVGPQRFVGSVRDFLPEPLHFTLEEEAPQ